MRGPATALIAVICFILLSCSTLFAFDFDAIQSSFTDTISEAYNSWTAQVQEVVPELANQWDQCTSEVVAAVAPLFTIGQGTNPVVSDIPGEQPGSNRVTDLCEAVDSFLGGIVSIPANIIWGGDSDVDSAQPSFTETISDAYNSWTAQVQEVVPEVAAAVAPLFTIGQGTNPVVSDIPGEQPGSNRVTDLCEAVDSFLGGIVSIPANIIWGEDSAAPDTVQPSFTETIGEAYNSWTDHNRAAMPELAAQWDHYTGEFGAAGAPLFVIGQVTNPVLSFITGAQPGSEGAMQWGKGVNDILGGVVNLPTKVLLGRDLSDPAAAPLEGLDRITAVTPGEALSYGLFVGSPAIAKGIYMAGYSEAIPALIRPGTVASCYTWPSAGFVGRALAGPLFGEKIGSTDNLFNAGVFAASLGTLAVFNHVQFNLVYPIWHETQFQFCDVDARFITGVATAGAYFSEGTILPVAGAIVGLLIEGPKTEEQLKAYPEDSFYRVAGSERGMWSKLYGSSLKNQFFYHMGRMIIGGI